MNLKKLNLEKVETGGKLDIFVIRDFLTNEECDTLMALIDANKKRSTVVGSSPYHEGRTSSSADLNYHLNPIIGEVNDKMNRHLPEWVPFDKSEIPQGQLYEPGEFFSDHTDWFDNPEYGGMSVNGQRNWTFMINLNDVEEGGETDFPHIDKKFKPRKGQAVIWRNTLPNGEGNPFALHAGRAPISGRKYIITKWYRDGVPRNIDPAGSSPSSRKVEPSNSGTFSSKEELPLLTELGFELKKIPEDIWGYIMDIYTLMRNEEEPEPRKAGFIDSLESDVPSTYFNMDKIHFIKTKLHEMLLPFHKDWIGGEIDIEPATCYGIRSYQRGATLSMHWDRVTELHVSGIVCVDVKEDDGFSWPLNIVGHDGVEREVTMRPGEILLYESATCEHGRKQPFKGDYYRNFYIHYKLKGWDYAS